MKTIPSSSSTLSLSLVCALALIPTTAPADPIWEQRYDGPAHSNDVAHAVAVDAAGNVAVTGKSLNANGDYDFYTAKYDGTDGHLFWEQRYDGINHADDVATAVVVDPAGNVVVTGYLADHNSVDDPGHIGINTKFYTAKYDATDGRLLWYHLGPDHGGLSNDPGRDNIRAAVDASGNVIIANHDTVGAYTAKYDATDGHLVWEHRYCGACSEIGFGLGDFLVGVALDGSGNVVVSGTAVVGPYPGNPNFYTAKYDASDGHILWEQFYGNLPHANGTAVAVDRAGDVAVTGTSQDALGNVYYHTEKYAADGHRLWQHDFKTDVVIDAAKVALDSGGNAIFSGTSSQPGGIPYDFYTAKYDATDGHLVWERRFDNCAGSAYQSVFSLYALALDDAGNAVVTGGAQSPGAYEGWGSPGWSYYTAKYAAADGHVLWEQRYDGPIRPLGVYDRHYSFATAVAVDSAGNTLVTGFSENADGISENYDFATVKYAGSPETAPPPRIACPANIVTSTAAGQCSAVVTYTIPAASDECGNPVPVTCTPAAGAVFPKGITTVNCSTASGSTCSFTVTVNDVENPTITCPANLVAHPPCGQTSMVVNYPAPSANDNCSGVIVTCYPPSGSVFPAGTTTVYCTARDASGNEAHCSFTVTVDTAASTFQFTGFLEPIGGADATGGSFASPLRAFKLKSTIPVKFKAACDGSLVLTGVHTLQAMKYSSETTGDTPIDATPTDAATSGNQFRLSDDEWHFNLDTKAAGLSAGIWQLRATLSDGSQHSAWIQIK